MALEEAHNILRLCEWLRNAIKLVKSASGWTYWFKKRDVGERITKMIKGGRKHSKSGCLGYFGNYEADFMIKAAFFFDRKYLL